MTINRLEGQNLGRNDPCPVCGRKMKHCSGHAGRKRVWAVSFLVGVVIACALALFLWWLLSSPSGGFHSMSPTEQIERLQRMLKEHFSARPEDEWWLDTWPFREEKFEEANARLEEMSQRLQKLVQQYREVSPLTREIANTFTRFSVAVYYQGGFERLRHPNADPIAFPLIEPNCLQVCFIPKNQIQMMPTTVFLCARVVGGGVSWI